MAQILLLDYVVGGIATAVAAIGASKFPPTKTSNDDSGDIFREGPSSSTSQAGDTGVQGGGEGRSQDKSNNGFTYQGKEYDPILQQQMEVSATTHGDFWEDDMDYSESVSYEDMETKTKTQATTQSQTKEKSCENCPPEGKVLPMVRRCSRWSMVTISYQTRICGTFYNPATQQIQEFKYCGVSFDGWKPEMCQFWEAKARYDQFFREDGTKKNWWTGDISAKNQAARHQAVATVNQPLKVVWIFMQPTSYGYFTRIFKLMPDIITRWQP